MAISEASLISDPHLFCPLLAQPRETCHNFENARGRTARSLVTIISLGIF